MTSIIIRTIVMYIVVTFAIRVMGKRQVGDMQPNELVITLLISEIAAIPLQDTKQPIITGIIAIFLLIILEIFVSFLTMKCFFLRKVMSGKSAVIIKNGVIDQKQMEEVRMTVLDLVELLRGKDIFNIDDVAFAVLEVNGDLSVLLKSEMQTATKQDVKATKENEGLPLPVISDGKIIKESLKALELNENDLYNIINRKGLMVKDIFLMTLDRYKNQKIVIMEDNV